MCDYTIVDLPLTNVAQANFLGRVLDPSLLVLSDESHGAPQNDRIRIFGPSWFDSSVEVFDVALNADSITEMDCRHATAYLAGKLYERICFYQPRSKSVQCQGLANFCRCFVQTSEKSLLAR